jgi:hypothetical protein
MGKQRREKARQKRKELHAQAFLKLSNVCPIPFLDCMETLTIVLSVHYKGWDEFGYTGRGVPRLSSVYQLALQLPTGEVKFFDWYGIDIEVKEVRNSYATIRR